MQGLFITVEGPDGAGKSTLIQRLEKKLLEELTVPLVRTREPGGSEIAEKIREVILDPKNTAMDDRTEALLYAASRRQHIMEKIKPSLAEGKVVLCDRFVDSSIAYQGAGRGIGVEEVATLNRFATEDLTPDITLYLDVDAQVGLNRIASKNSNREKDRLELEAISFHNRVRNAYKVLLKKHPERIQLIDASQNADDVFNDAWKVVQEKIQEIK
ncbi:MAG TPA: dTMP kinase [Atopostipes sp.]|nr:dTMP kinase [Atopostipes sp.]